MEMSLDTPADCSSVLKDQYRRNPGIRWHFSLCFSHYPPVTRLQKNGSVQFLDSNKWIFSITPEYAFKFVTLPKQLIRSLIPQFSYLKLTIPLETSSVKHNFPHIFT